MRCWPRWLRGPERTREEWADVQRVITETAPHDKAAGAVHAERVKRYRSALDAVADRLATLEGPTFDRDRAAAILWFYFGPSSYLPLHDDFGWSYEETETWLLAQCEHALDLTEPLRNSRAQPFVAKATSGSSRRSPGSR